jgi:hypothetical protein
MSPSPVWWIMAITITLVIFFVAYLHALGFIDSPPRDHFVDGDEGDGGHGISSYADY